MRKVKQTEQKEIGRIKFTGTREVVASLVDSEKLDLRVWVDSDSYKEWTKKGLRGIEFSTEKFLLWGEARCIFAKVEMEDFESLYGSGSTIDLGKIRGSISGVFYQATL